VRVEADVTPRSADKIRVTISDADQHSSRPARNRVALHRSRNLQDHGGKELWLAFCRVVLEAHGERLWISRSDDAGITVTFTLPQVSESLAQLEAFS